MTKISFPGYMTPEQKELERRLLEGNKEQNIQEVTNMNIMIDTLDRIAYERGSQDKKWGVQTHTPVEWVTILGEEFGEVCNVVCKTVESAKHDVSLDRAHYERELIQVAAVCVAAIECIRRQHGEPNASTTRTTRVRTLRTDYR